MLHYKIEEALRAPILHSGLCNTRMFARAMGLATRASLIQYYWVECRCSAPAFSPSTEERAPSTRWKEAFSLNDAFSSACLHAAPRVKPAALLYIVTDGPLRTLAQSARLTRLAGTSSGRGRTNVNPRTTQKMMMSQVSTSSIYTDLFSTSRNHTMMHEPHAAGSPIHCTPSSSSLLCFF